MNSYDKLMALKRLYDGAPDIYRLFNDLNARIEAKSKNRLIICRTAKDAREAIKMASEGHIGEVKYNFIKLWLKIDGITLYFMPITRLEEGGLTGLKFSGYYFDETWRGVIR